MPPPGDAVYSRTPGDSVYSRTPGDSVYSRTNSVDRHMLGRSLPGSTPSSTSRPAAGTPGTSSPAPTPTGGAVSPTSRLSMSGAASTGLGALVSPSKPSAAGAIQATKYVGVVSPTGRTRSVSASVQGSTSTLLMGRGESVESDWEGNQVNAFTLAMDSLSPTPRGMSPVERGDTAASNKPDPTASPILRAVPRPATPTVSAPATPRLVPLPGDPPRRTPARTTKLDRAVQALLVWTAAVWPVAVPVAGMYWRTYVALRSAGKMTALDGMVGKDRVGMAPRAPAPS
ncbi:hypothetical protein GGF32_009092 [Allomyces javanicus]|nr:hypothetical protein GGF32_009092 [Allomyces javanicus]